MPDSKRHKVIVSDRAKNVGAKNRNFPDAD